jgi:predicted DNA-binding transcriptional regulator AlpA
MKDLLKGYPKHMVDAEKASCFLRLPQVLALVPIGRSTLFEKVKRGEFPKQIKLGEKTSVWLRSDIDAYIAKMSGVSND